MGEIIKSSAVEWTQRVEQIRTELITSAKTGNRMLAAFATAKARAELMQTIQNEEIAALLTTVTSPELGMVELIANPTPEDRVRVCAMAILSGFVPGDEPWQFSIYGGGRTKDNAVRPGKLYTKEAGYRVLFSHLGIVPEVHVDLPEFVPYGTAGKKAWRIGGYARCEYQGRQHEVRSEIESDKSDYRIALNGYESDNVAGVAAKARRRLLQQLWAMVSPVLNEPQADDDEVIDVNPQKIEVQPVTDQPQEPDAPQFIPSMDDRRLACLNDYNRAIKMVSKDESAAAVLQEIWEAFANARSCIELRKRGGDYKSAKAGFSHQVQDILSRWFYLRQDELSQGVQ